MDNKQQEKDRKYDKRSNALRENLLKRKQQAKDKKESEKDNSTKED